MGKSEVLIYQKALDGENGWIRPRHKLGQGKRECVLQGSSHLRLDLARMER
jgi:hypothetical protein